MYLTGFPNVLGCIDDTFIRIQKPSENETDFVNRKGYLALNVQVLFLFCFFYIISSPEPKAHR